MIDETLSQLSDLAFAAATACYLVALACHALEVGSRRAERAAPQRELVAAGGSSVAGVAADSGDGAPDAAAATDSGDGHRPAGRRSFADRVVRGAVVVTGIGLVAQIAALVLRGMATSRLPWGNMYEFTLLIIAGAVATWLVLLWRWGAEARALGIWVLTPLVILAFLNGTVLYTQAGPVAPILNNYWLPIHVVTISLSSGVLMVTGFASAAYLFRLRHDERVATGQLSEAAGRVHLPSADKLDRLAYRTAIAAFPFYTFSIIAGAMWAEVAWGRYWGWDPKEVVALITWIAYAGYLHARATAGWRGKPAAWVSVVGLVTIIFNLFFVNMVVTGLHSYAGL